LIFLLFYSFSLVAERPVSLETSGITDQGHSQLAARVTSEDH